MWSQNNEISDQLPPMLHSWNIYRGSHGPHRQLPGLTITPHPQARDKGRLFPDCPEKGRTGCCVETAGLSKFLYLVSRVWAKKSGADRNGTCTGESMALTSLLQMPGKINGTSTKQCNQVKVSMANLNGSSLGESTQVLLYRLQFGIKDKVILSEEACVSGSDAHINLCRLLCSPPVLHMLS